MEKGMNLMATQRMKTIISYEVILATTDMGGPEPFSDEDNRLHTS